MSQGTLSVPEGLDVEEWKTFKVSRREKTRKIIHINIRSFTRISSIIEKYEGSGAAVRIELFWLRLF